MQNLDTIPLKIGVNFCGYRIFETHKLLRQGSKKKINKNMKKWNKEWENKKIDMDSVQCSLSSWLGHIKHSNSYNLKEKAINKCEFFYTNVTALKDHMELIKYIESEQKK